MPSKETQKTANELNSGAITGLLFEAFSWSVAMMSNSLIVLGVELGLELFESFSARKRAICHPGVMPICVFIFGDLRFYAVGDVSAIGRPSRQFHLVRSDAR